MKNLKRVVQVMSFAFVLSALVACDSGGGGSSKPVVGPKIRGKWTGVYFIDGVGDSERDIKAKIKQDGEAITIKTTLVEIGEKLTGTIDEGGDMFLTDNFDGETWTTYFGPATENFVQVADLRPDLSENAVAVIQLSR